MSVCSCPVFATLHLAEWRIQKNVSHKFVPRLVHVVEAEQWLGCAHDFSEVNRLLDASLTWQFLWDPAGLKDMGNIC